MSSLSTYSPADSLSVMKEIIPPDPVRYSFDTPGWHVVEGLLLFSLIVMAVYYLDKWYKNAYRREALKTLNGIKGLKPGDIRKINILLKQVTLTAFPEENPGSLTGEPWFGFLKSKVKKCTLSEEEFLSVLRYSYTVDEKPATKEINDKTLNEFVEFSTYWIRRHEV